MPEDSRSKGFFALITEDNIYKGREHERPQELLDKIAKQFIIIGGLNFEAIQEGIMEEARRCAQW